MPQRLDGPIVRRDHDARRVLSDSREERVTKRQRVRAIGECDLRGDGTRAPSRRELRLGCSRGDAYPEPTTTQCAGAREGLTLLGVEQEDIERGIATDAV